MACALALSELLGERVAQPEQHVTRARFDATARIAIVAPRDVMFGLARMTEALHAGSAQIEAFRDRAKAVAWLNAWTSDTEFGPRSCSAPDQALTTG